MKIKHNILQISSRETRLKLEGGTKIYNKKLKGEIY